MACCSVNSYQLVLKIKDLELLFWGHRCNLYPSTHNKALYAHDFQILIKSVPFSTMHKVVLESQLIR